MQFIKPGKSEYYNHCYDLEHYFPTKWNGPIHIFDDKLSEIAAYGMEGFAEPHFHIITDGYPDICVKLMTNEYYGNPSIILKDDECKRLNDFLKTRTCCIYKYSPANSTVWSELFEAWNNGDGNVGYGYYEAEKYINNIPDYSTIHRNSDFIIPDIEMDTELGICKIEYAPNGSSITINFVHNENIIAYADMLNKTAYIDCRFVEKKYRENLYFNLNSWLYNELSLNNAYLYNYQYIIMNWLHCGFTPGFNYLYPYYDWTKLKIRFINKEN